MNNIHLMIRKVRNEKGYSQEFMAMELGISQSSYAKIEQNKTPLSYDRLYRIADILDMDISQLMDGNQNSKDLQKEVHFLKLLLEEKDKQILHLQETLQLLKRFVNIHE